MRAVLPVVLILWILSQGGLTPSTGEMAGGATPEAAVRGLIEAFNALDLKRAAGFLITAGPASALATLEVDLKSQSTGRVTLKVEQVRVEESGERAIVALKLILEMTPPTAPRQSLEDRIELVRGPRGWKIRPPGAPASVGPPTGVLAPIFTSLTDPGAVLLARQAARQDLCRLNMRNLLVGVRFFVDDHEDRFAFSRKNYQSRLLPYVRKDPTHFVCPETRTPYTLNPKIEAASQQKMFRPGATVVFYEGADGKLDFRHLGAACVGFADGSIRLVTPEEASVLRWNP